MRSLRYWLFAAPLAIAIALCATGYATEALLGWLHGGLAIVALLVCAFFTAFTGVSGVTIIAFGALLLPAVRLAVRACRKDGAVLYCALAAEA